MSHNNLYSKLLLLLVFLFLSASFASAMCDITVFVQDPLTLEGSIQWTDCDGGQGIQGALNRIASNGGGTLNLTGPGSILVGSPLSVGANTHVVAPYGNMTFVGDNDPGQSYRNRAVFEVNNIISNPYAITLYQLTILGDTSGRPLVWSGIKIASSTNISIVTCTISKARTGAIVIYTSSSVKVQWSTIEMKAKDVGPYYPSATAIWSNGCDDCLIQGNTITAPTYYDAESSNIVCDLVSLHDGSKNQFLANYISYTNAAGIYLTNEGSPIIDGNSVHHVLQNGLDVADSTGIQMTNNGIYSAAEHGIQLGNDNGGVVRDNNLWDIAIGTSWPPGWVVGALWLVNGTTGISASSNDIAGGGTHYAVYFSGSSSGNTLTGNDLWAGIVGYVGEETGSSNTIYSNTYH